MDVMFYAFAFLIVVGFIRKTFSSETDQKKIQAFKSECLDLATDTVGTARQVMKASKEVLDFK